MSEKTEQDRRVYYQDIVYNVCSQLDRHHNRMVTRGQGVVCGTVDEPSTDVQDDLEKTLSELTTLRQERAVLVKACWAVIKHQDLVGGTMGPACTTRRIAADALARIGITEMSNTEE